MREEFGNDEREHGCGERPGSPVASGEGRSRGSGVGGADIERGRANTGGPPAPGAFVTAMSMVHVQNARAKGKDH